MKIAVILLIFFQMPLLINLIDVSETHLPQADLAKNSMDVVSRDIDNDGDEDLVIACEFCPNIILVNGGTGKFTNESALRLPQKRHDSEDIAAEDFDGDGDIDLVFVSEDDKINEYYINNGKGFFVDASGQFPVTGITNAVMAVDVDGDGDKDLVLGNDGQDVLLLNDGKGNWTAASDTHFPIDADVTQDVKAFDADGDGDMDLVFGNEDAGKIYFNDGKGRFVNNASALPGVLVTVETRKVEVEDVDQDGDVDLLFCNVAFREGRNKHNLLLLNNGKGKFTDATDSHYSGDNNLMSLDAQFLDLNGDGWKDLIIANGFGGRVQYFQNNKGKFSELTGSHLPQITGDVISLLYFRGSKSQDYLYLGFFRGKDKLLQVK